LIVYIRKPICSADSIRD